MENEADFVNLVASGSSLHQECALNLGSSKVRKAVNALASFLEKINESPQPVVSAFCSGISSWFRILSVYPKHRKIVLRCLINCWTGIDEQIRLHSAVAILGLCKSCPSILEKCVKKMYLAFLKACKSVSGHNIHTVSLMTNTMLEVLSLNADKLSNFVFSSIRKLSEIIRVSLKDPSKSNLKKVFSWPFCAAIKLWGLLLCKSTSPKMERLITPAMSLCMEICCIQASKVHAPFYLQMVRIALDVMEAKQLFIPVNHILGHLIKSVCGKKTIGGTSKITGNMYCLSFMIKASTSDQSNQSYLEALFEDCHALLMRYISITSNWACFPEIGANCQDLISSSLAQCRHSKFKSTLSVSKNKLQKLIGSSTQARVSFGLPPNSYDSSHVLENFAAIDFKSYAASLHSVQKIKEQQVAKQQSAKALPAKPATKKASKNAKPVKIASKKVKIATDDTLVDFEL